MSLGVNGSELSHNALREEDDLEEEHIFDNPYVRVILILLYSAVFIFCFFGNLTVVLVTTFHWRMRSVTKFCLSNLAFANLCVGIFCIYQNLSQYFFNGWIFGEFFCKMYHFVNSLSHTASIFILVVICVERYLVILHPFKCRRILTIQRLRLIIFGVWIMSGVICSPRLYYMVILEDPFSLKNNSSHMVCVPRSALYDFKTSDLVHFVVLYLIPLSIISILYAKVAMFLRERDVICKNVFTSSLNLPSSMKNPEVVQNGGELPEVPRAKPPRRASSYCDPFVAMCEDDPPAPETPEALVRSKSRLAQNGKTPKKCEDRPKTLKEFLLKKYHQGKPPLGGGPEIGPLTEGIVRDGLDGGKGSKKVNNNSLANGGKSLTGALGDSEDWDNGRETKRMGDSVSGNSIPLQTFLQLNQSTMVRINFSRQVVQYNPCGEIVCFSTKITSMKRPHKAVVRMLIMVVLAFAICNMPYHLRKLYQNYLFMPQLDGYWSELLTPITYLFMYLNCALNPFLYGFMSKGFRNCCIELLKCNMGKSPKPVDRRFP